MENRVLLFVIGDRVAGAYFHLPGGMPELPKVDASAVPEPPKIDLSGLPIPPHIVAMLSKMGQKEQQAFAKLPQDKKMQWIKLLLQKHVAAARWGRSQDMQREAERLAVEALRQNDGVRDAVREIVLKQRGGTYALRDGALGSALHRDNAEAL
ncbi:hypothetical protein NUW54_g13854 [Trametes sanguinea]|uniref:Uncharacterized protein n=1 Tax=Trametes sanguinea TaxID=158606 RepID=A0ACC1MHT1_9APHY|nr:hypothetical protein NUW54_g13854 [Trametes sanguinea]